MTTLDDETKIQISKVQAVTPRARPSAEHEGEVRHEASHRADHHSGRRGGVRRMELRATRTPHMMIIMTLPPPHIQKDIELLQRVPRVDHRYRTRPLARVARWFIRERERLAVESEMDGYRSALRCHRETGIGYRRARAVQDRREHGQRIGRGKA